jgi:O6-methylguanine-DNA--protein-cysteine methyltransferase
MFAHIRKFHETDFFNSTSRHWIEEAENGEPLRVFWETTNDFDEQETTVLFVCLSTNKTFTQHHKCLEHFKKDKKALKDHNSQIKQLKKDFAKYKKEKSKQAKKSKVDPATQRFVQAVNSNDPDLARAYWRRILNDKSTLECCKMLCQRREYQMETPMYLFDKKHRIFEQIPYGEFMTHYNDLMEKINFHFTSRCLNVKVVQALHFEAMDFWRTNFSESMMNLNEDLRLLQPLYNIGVGDEEFFEVATKEMPSVDF